MEDQVIVQIKDSVFRWPGEKEDTLSIPHFEIRRGEKVLIKGRSGSGKSTLLSLLSGIQVVDRGELLVKGKNLKLMKPDERDLFRGDHIGYIFQQFNLLSYLSIQDNILSPLLFSNVKKEKETRDRDRRVQELLDHLALNVDPHKSVQSLSIGQQQRVAAARALIGEPEIIIADEPTSALDRSSAEDLINHLFKECDRLNTTLIFVSHNDTLDNLFPRVVYIDDISHGQEVSNV